MVLIATVALVVVTITTNKDKSPPKTPTMKEWMTSPDGVKTLTKALQNVDSTTKFGFNITGNANTATTAESAEKAKTAESADKAKTAEGAEKLSKMYGPSWYPPPVGSWCGSTDKENPTYYWSKRHICQDLKT